MSSALVILKMYTGSNIFLWAFLLVISLAIIFDKIENKFTYLIFFISWVYTLKFSFNQFSLFLFISVLYIVVCLIYILMHNLKLQFKLLLSYLLFATYVIAIPLIGGGSLTTILGFLINYTAIFIAVLFIKDKSLYGKYINMYAIGLLLSSVVRFISYSIPNLNQYFLNMATTQTLIVGGELNIRFAGADLDPNYYSIQVLIAISCLLVNIYYSKRNKKSSILLAVILSSLGLLSLSKMYLIALVFLICITLISLIKNNITLALKFIFFIIVFGGVIASFSFDYFYNSFVQRFDAGGTFDSLTTGRGTIWLMYLSEIFNNMKLLFLGTGYGTGFLNNIASHNMYLLALYYMGLIGIVITMFYIKSLREMFIIKTEQKKHFQLLSVNAIPLLVLLFSNLSLDSFVMDFFPIHLFIVLFSLDYKSEVI